MVENIGAPKTLRGKQVSLARNVEISLKCLLAQLVSLSG